MITNEKYTTIRDSYGREIEMLVHDKRSGEFLCKYEWKWLSDGWCNEIFTKGNLTSTSRERCLLYKEMPAS